jgi:hypothetical protein
VSQQGTAVRIKRHLLRIRPVGEDQQTLAPALGGGGYGSPIPTNRGILIGGRLKHLPSGHFEDSFMPAPLDTTGGKSDVQAVGSTNSFLRRYMACNIFNIVVAEDDDDGAGGAIDEGVNIVPSERVDLVMPTGRLTPRAESCSAAIWMGKERQSG